MKRVVDTLLIVMSFPFLLPMLLVVACIVARDGNGPLYSQKRLGRGGRVFRIWKFRTMVPDAEAELKRMIARDPEIAEEWHTHQKLKHDPRITKIGHILRKTSIDELPQLWNVLKGDMSLVGPRPMLTDQQELYPGTAYFEMRPGLTGLWQISDRHNTTFAARASFDATYYQQMSFATDCRIMASTVGVVMRGTGC
ncbi:sugar transferase [Yoonia sp. 2307UL14-13]|uniref:sugar transferase n=1 Tax=Yoonia sp. 2307UL14-13 TaxID=3126506 RepID=UPI00309B1960